MGSPILVPSQGTKIGFSQNIGTSFDYLANVLTVDPDPAGEGAKIQSSSNDDSSPDGIGIQQVRVRYFDVNWVLNEELVNLTGTTPVTMTASNIMRIEMFEASQVGTTEEAAGTITLTSTDGTKLFAQIDPANVAFYTSVHTVSPGMIGYIYDFAISCGTSPGAEFAIFIEKDNTDIGGGVTLIPDLGFILVNNSVASSQTIPVTCDASGSSVGLRMGVIAKGLAINQIGSASYHYNELS